ncbi:hypothetical protein [Litoreibacter roseus]|uniref:Subtilase family protein n=1 Tax=Litoreibacter roseus TaxID=2601869 RepID=A0A6N6JNJ2_9RHOB|nr:hypothetical protein [Litoreibacter roseus]GFE66998.1 hypothetical protein KIN_40720 [Litoreibacter roseus]
MAKESTSSDTFPEVAVTDPYVDWWSKAEGSRKTGEAGEFNFQKLRGDVFGLRNRRGSSIFQVPLPKKAKNFKFCPTKWQNWAATAADYSHVEANDVILGVIDTNFALGHRRFRFKDGSTRFLSAWLQGAPSEQAGAPHLPFGRELSTTEIEEKLKEHSDGCLDNPLDQEGFNRALGLVDPDKPVWEGSKELQMLASHGTHMLDVAGGIDPGRFGSMRTGENSRCHLIAVALPPLFFHGHSGNFLQYHAVLGLIRILRIADAISKAKHKEGCENFDSDHQFPIVVSFSFGFEAGPKDGSLDMERAIREEIRKRANDGDDDSRTNCQGKTPNAAGNRKRRDVKTFVNMPAGNSNLSRISARETIAPEGHTPFEVVLQPNDHSSTFIEFWSETFNRTSKYFKKSKLEIKLPNGQMHTIEISKPKNRTPEMKDIPSADGKSVIGRVYYSLRRSGLRAEDRVRLRVVVALAPTLVFYDMKTDAIDGSKACNVDLAPAGRWTFEFKGLKNTLRFDANIQADLFDSPFSQNARRAYFDHPDYQDFIEGGRVRDSFTYSDPIEKLDSGPVTRVGSHNALASTPYASMIGGYRGSDGQPAPYSATGYKGPPDYNNQSDVDVALPCEDGVLHFGVLGAGPRDGAALALNGTSVATALASRMMVDCLLLDPRTEVGQPWLQTAARTFKKSGRPDGYLDPAPLKVGAGHIPYPDSYDIAKAGLGMRKRRRHF